MLRTELSGHVGRNEDAEGRPASVLGSGEDAGAMGTARRWSIRSMLACLVLACLLPVMAGVAFFFFHKYEIERDRMETARVVSARALVQVIDSHLEAAKVSAMAISSAGSLARRDWGLFHRRAQQLVADTGIGSNVVLYDRSGQQLVNTLRGVGVRLPKHSNPALLERVFETGKAEISDLYVGNVKGEPVISVDVPVLVNGKIAYDLSVTLEPSSIDAIRRTAAFPPDWVVGIFDSSGTIVARSHASEKYVGQKANSEFFAKVEGALEGSAPSVTNDGIPVQAGWSRSLATGWSVAIGVPQTSIQDELVQSLVPLGLGMLFLLAVGLGLAMVVGRKISRSVTALHGPAIALGSSQVFPIPRVEVSEVAEVAKEINRAAELLAARTAALQGANQLLVERDASLRKAHRLARFGDWQLELASGCVTVSDSVREILGRDVSVLVDFKDAILPARSWEAFQSAIRNALMSETGFDLELPATNGNGRDMWVNIKGGPVKDREGAGTGLLGTIMDVTQRKEAVVELEAVQKAYQRQLEEQVAERTASLMAANAELERSTRRDSLTGLHNRIAADESLRQEFLLLKRSGCPYAVLFMDIDHFKSINDTYGHEIGDHVLRRFAILLADTVRESDFLARFGGEEFLAVLPNTLDEGAILIAEKIRSAIETHDFGPVPHITLSIGVASGAEVDLREEDVVRRADTALYDAKNSGRNTVRLRQSML